MKRFNVAVAARNMAKARKGRAPKRSRKAKAQPDFVSQAWDATVEFTQDKKRELGGLMALLAGVALVLALVPREPNLLGPAGHGLFRFFFGALGLSVILVPAGLLALAWSKLAGHELHAPSVKLAGWSLIAVAATAILNLAWPEAIGGGLAGGLYWGGLLGRLLGGAMLKGLSTAGTLVLCAALLAVAVYLLEQEGAVKMLFLQAYERLRLRSLGFKAAQLPELAPARRRAQRSVEAEEDEEAEPFVEAVAPKRRKKIEEAVTEAVADAQEAAAMDEAQVSDIKLIDAKGREDNRRQVPGAAPERSRSARAARG